jgi:hypothetical protein
VQSSRGAPPTGHTACPHGGLGVKEGDDDVHQLVGEAGEEFKVKAHLRHLRFWLELPLVGCLVLHLSRRHRQPKNFLGERGICGDTLGVHIG